MVKLLECESGDHHPLDVCPVTQSYNNEGAAWDVIHGCTGPGERYGQCKCKCGTDHRISGCQHDIRR